MVEEEYQSPFADSEYYLHPEAFKDLKGAMKVALKTFEAEIGEVANPEAVKALKKAMKKILKQHKENLNRASETQGRLDA